LYCRVIYGACINCRMGISMRMGSVINDRTTNAPETDYFFTGNGNILAVIQWSRHPDLTPYGLLLSDPERMTRKEGTYLFHPESGLSKTMLTVVLNGKRYRPQHERTTVEWILSPDNNNEANSFSPLIQVQW